MTTSDAIDKLMSALVQARMRMTPAAKDGENKYDKYSYATELDYHDAIQPSAHQRELVVIFGIDEVSQAVTRMTKEGGTAYFQEVRGYIRIFHSSGQWLEIKGYGCGQDRGDKAAYKAITGMKKYLYAMAFSLPTTDDPEVESHDEPSNFHQRQSNGHEKKEHPHFAAIKNLCDEVGADPRLFSKEIGVIMALMMNKPELMDASPEQRRAIYQTMPQGAFDHLLSKLREAFSKKASA